MDYGIDVVFYNTRFCPVLISGRKGPWKGGRGKRDLYHKDRTGQGDETGPAAYHPPREAFQWRTVSFIGAELLYQETRTMGIKVDQAEIDKKWEELKKNYTSDDDLKSALKDLNLTEESVKFQIERGLAIQEFIQTEFIQKAIAVHGKH